MGGRGAADLGRARNLGINGGGTWRRVSPHNGHWSEPTVSARIQFPFIWHCGFTHWTVEPGMMVILNSPSSRQLTLAE